MRSLLLKISLVFLIISLVQAGLAAYFARQVTEREFDRYRQQQAQNNFIADVTEFYEANGTLMDIARSLYPGPRKPPLPPPRNNGPERSSDRRAPRPAPQPVRFLLADANGKVVIPSAGHEINDTVKASELTRGLAVEVGGQFIGTILDPKDIPGRDPEEERYLERTNQALINAALGASIIALIVGIFMARRLTLPLKDLTTATQAMAKGTLGHQVPVQSQDELGELTKAFNHMSAELADAAQVRRQMTADIAHELRTPLTVMSGYIEAMRDGVLDPSSDRLEMMYAETQQLTRLVADLRMLSLADAGELSLNLQTVSPDVLLERSAASFREHAAKQGINLRIEAKRHIAQVRVDLERMAQVLGNLVSNALRYTPRGGHIVLSVDSDDSSVQIVIADNGSGIEPESLPRIFDRFFRIDESRLQEYGESGLGLAIAKSIVEAHGGTIDVESEVGYGTKFMIALPAGG